MNWQEESRHRTDMSKACNTGKQAVLADING